MTREAAQVLARTRRARNRLLRRLAKRILAKLARRFYWRGRGSAAGTTAAATPGEAAGIFASAAAIAPGSFALSPRDRPGC